MLEKQYHEELKMEIEGNTFSNISNKKSDIPADVEGDESEEAKEDDPIKQAADDAEEISKSLMSNRKRGLLKAMEVHVLAKYMHPSIHKITMISCSTGSNHLSLPTKPW
jgi:pescadillo protein